LAPVAAFHSQPALRDPSLTQKVKSTVSSVVNTAKDTASTVADTVSQTVNDTFNKMNTSGYNTMDQVDADKVGTHPTMKDRLAQTGATVKEAADEMLHSAEKGWQNIKNAAFETKGRVEERAHMVNKDMQNTNTGYTTTTGTTTTTTGPTMENNAYELKGRAEQKLSDIGSDIKSTLNSTDNKAHELKGRALERTGN